MTTLAYARRWTDTEPRCEVVLLKDGTMAAQEITESQAINMAQELIGYVGSLRRLHPESSKQDAPGKDK